MNLHKYQLYLLEQHSESFKIWSAISEINTEGTSLIWNWVQNKQIYYNCVSCVHDFFVFCLCCNLGIIFTPYTSACL